MFTEKATEALYHYILWNDIEFEKLTEGPEHRNLLISLLKDKKLNSLIRERLIAKHLHLVHNTRMHSTTHGKTTFDATDPLTGNHYEIKAEQYVTNNIDRDYQGGQLAGTGLFSHIVDQAGLDKLKNDNPIIAHSMFGDGRLLCLSTFRLLDSAGFDRISEYCLSSTKTAPRYLFSDWSNCNFNLVFVSDKWPDHAVPKYKKFFQNRWKIKQALLSTPPENISLPIPDSALSTKNLPNWQDAIPYTEWIALPENRAFPGIPSIGLSGLSLSK